MAKRRVRQQQIRTNVTMTSGSRFVLRGWLSGKGTYLWFGEHDVARDDLSIDHGRFFGVLDGPKLYRLAKAIVRHFEEGK